MRHPSHPLLALLVPFALWVLAACAPADDVLQQTDDDAGETATQPTAITSPGCSIENLTLSFDDGSACASCAGAQGSASICGTLDTASCYSRQNAFGDVCQHCETDSGEVLFDDCVVSLAAARCESVPSDPSQPDDAGSACSVCFDESGEFVASICGPAADECHEVGIAARTCVECTDDGVVVRLDCGPLGIDPTFCVAYGNDEGHCIDCFDANDGVLSHQCTVYGGVAPITCTERVDPSGVSCLACLDNNGTMVESSCDVDEAEAEYCEQLSYTDEECVVCLDGDGTPYEATCEYTACALAGTCPLSTGCSYSIDAEGNLCRSCAFDDGAETSCLTGAPLECATLSDGLENCIQCIDQRTDTEVYFACGDGPGEDVAPPTCSEVDNPTSSVAGDTCTACFDETSDAPVYTACDNFACYAVANLPVVDALQQPVTLADCVSCDVQDPSSAGGYITQTSCTPATSSCGAPPGYPGQDGLCSEASAVLLLPRACNNLWESQTDADQAGSLGELVGVLSVVTQAGLSAERVATAPGITVPSCDDTCDCRRGDALSLLTTTPQTIATLFADVVLPCAVDDDCPDTSVCGFGVCLVP